MPKGAETLLGRKPYTFVPILEVRPQDRRGIVSHNQFERGRFTGQLRLSLEVIAPLHIGCGSFRLSQGKVAYGFYRRNGRPAIPGSSLKGAVRSLAEAASRSCATLPTRNCPRLEDALPRGAGKSCNDESACPSCRLFGFVHGRNGYRGRVVFGEFVAEGNSSFDLVSLPQLERPFKDYPRVPDRRHCGNERLYYCRFYSKVDCEGPSHCLDCRKDEWLSWYHRLRDADLPEPLFRGRKFYLKGHLVKGERPFEVATPGSVFSGEVTFFNLDRSELALLCFALGLDGEVRLSLGYGKPAYLGSVTTTLCNLTGYDRPWLSPPDDEIDPVTLAREYGKDDVEVLKNVTLLREILSGQRQGPNWQGKGY